MKHTYKLVDIVEVQKKVFRLGQYRHIYITDIEYKGNEAKSRIFSGNGLENCQLAGREVGRVALIRILSNTLVGLP
jgi:hypothetical protein